MYKFSDKQISFSDFGQPVGMKMSAEKRWVKKAELIPWNEIELQYAKLFINRKGNVAKPCTGRSYAPARACNLFAWLSAPALFRQNTVFRMLKQY